MGRRHELLSATTTTGKAMPWWDWPLAAISTSLSAASLTAFTAMRVTGHEIHVGDGQLSFRVRANSAGVYVLNGPGKIGVDGAYLR